MENKDTPFLDFYKKYIRTGCLPSNGLCNSLHNNKTLALFAQQHPEHGDSWYWGYDGNIKNGDDCSLNYMYEFTPLRQNIVLFCAAINNEL